MASLYSWLPQLPGHIAQVRISRPPNLWTPLFYKGPRMLGRASPSPSKNAFFFKFTLIIKTSVPHITSPTPQHEHGSNRCLPAAPPHSSLTKETHKFLDPLLSHHPSTPSCFVWPSPCSADHHVAPHYANTMANALNQVEAKWMEIIGHLNLWILKWLGPHDFERQCILRKCDEVAGTFKILKGIWNRFLSR